MSNEKMSLSDMQKVARWVVRGIDKNDPRKDDATQEAYLAMLLAASKVEGKGRKYQRDCAIGAVLNELNRDDLGRRRNNKANKVKLGRLDAKIKAGDEALYVWEAVGDDTFADPAEVAEQKEQHEQLHLALATLPHNEREILTRKFLGGETYVDIAESMGLSVQAVHQTATRAMEKLRCKLAS